MFIAIYDLIELNQGVVEYYQRGCDHVHLNDHGYSRCNTWLNSSLLGGGLHVHKYYKTYTCYTFLHMNDTY